MAEPENTHGARRSLNSPIAVGLTVAGLLALVVIGIAPATGHGGAAPQPAASVFTTSAMAPASLGPTGSWAWGAAMNASFAVQYVGAYNASMALTGGNLTTQGAYVSVDDAAHIAYAVYAVANLTSPNATDRYVTLRAAELQGEYLGVAATGTFPAAGTYTSGSPVHLVPMSIALNATVVVLSAYVAYLNLTAGPNGSLSLDNEHVAYARAVNLSLVAVNFPNVTRTSPTNYTLAYNTGAISEQAYVAVDLRANFSPALPLVEGPLFVGKSWWANSTATIVGAGAYAANVQAKAPNGATYHASSSGAVQVNVSGPVALWLTVTRSTTVVYPNGQNETDYEIADASGATRVVLANGLVVLPAQDPGKAAGIVDAVPEHPAAAAATPPSVAPNAAIYSPERGRVAAQVSRPSTGSAVTAAPLTVDQANAAMSGLGHPTRPSPTATGSSPFGLALLLIGAAAVGGVLLARRSRRRGSRRQAPTVPPGASQAHGAPGDGSTRG
ncbi:MAG TPA: hypothetical protein VFF67_09900 [Thermoplasmata archaeon]|nr:hypothetical protein [Thermoplasmata archaeon]